MDAKTKKKVYIILIIVLAVSLVLWLFAEGVHELGAYIILGFVGGWITIFLGKILLPKWLARSEDYYDIHNRIDLYGDGTVLSGGDSKIPDQISADGDSESAKPVLGTADSRIIEKSDGGGQHVQ